MKAITHTMISAFVDAIPSNRNPGAARKYFGEQYFHIPSNQSILRENVQKLVKVQEKVKKDKCFTC